VTAAPLSLPGVAAPQTAESQAAQAKQAAKQLEAFFLRQFLAEARPDTSVLGGGFAGDTFKDMLDSALADSMAAAGGLGMATSFESQLGAPVRPQMPGPIAAQQPELQPVEGTFIRPTAGRYSSSFGTRVDPLDHTHRAHNGLDIAAREGTPVVAAAGGVVERAGAAGTYGNLVVLRHTDGSETRYAHLSAINVQKGDTVAAGTPIGAVGTTGRSTGPHLHFEVRRDGRPVDPWPLLQDAKVGVTP
jgi:murein DD-endopeptidase MepM/ murein hydrolase activator NlpD